MAPTSRGLLLPLLTLAGLLACSSDVEPAAPEAAPQDRPTEGQPPDAGPTQNAPAAAGTISTGVTWRVVEAGGGAVDSAGRYTAPGVTGTFHVVATSAADTTKTGTATVTVVAPVVVAVSPATATVAAGASRTFTATVTGTANTAVTWRVQEASGCGSITGAGVYTAPAAAATCHVSATSVADGVTSGVATVTVTAPPPPVVVAIGPAAPAVDACQALTFTATVTGTTNTAVNWTVQEGATGGAITSGGVYTAPDTAGTYHVVATSQAAPSSSASLGVTVTERVVSVALTPPTITILSNGNAQFTATVTTTCGSATATLTTTAAR